jgi:hypothetical protein
MFKFSIHLFESQLGLKRNASRDRGKQLIERQGLCIFSRPAWQFTCLRGHHKPLEGPKTRFFTLQVRWGLRASRGLGPASIPCAGVPQSWFSGLQLRFSWPNSLQPICVDKLEICVSRAIRRRATMQRLQARSRGCPTRAFDICRISSSASCRSTDRSATRRTPRPRSRS